MRSISQKIREKIRTIRAVLSLDPSLTEEAAIMRERERVGKGRVERETGRTERESAREGEREREGGKRCERDGESKPWSRIDRPAAKLPPSRRLRSVRGTDYVRE